MTQDLRMLTPKMTIAMLARLVRVLIVMMMMMTKW